MTSGRPLAGTEIIAFVAEVADELDAYESARHTVVLVGGSLLACRGLRDSTEDVDSVLHLDDELRAAVARVAVRHDLSADWLNANAAGFIPATFDLRACEVLFDHPRLLVLGAPLRDVFVMKMYRAGPNDVADLIVMWPHVDFTDAQQVVDAFAAAYPHGPYDPHLGAFVVEIAARAGDDIRRR